MKHTVLKTVGSALLIAGITFALPAYAQTQGGTHAMGMDKKPATATTDKEKHEHMGKMQEAMLRMHEQTHKIMDAKNPQEREQLVQEHTKMMQEHMHMMQGMMGNGAKMDAGQHKQMDASQHQHMDQMHKHMDQMRQQMDQMHKHMDQMHKQMDQMGKDMPAAPAKK